MVSSVTFATFGVVPTLLEILQVTEFYQVVAIVVVGDVDFVVLGKRVLHPSPFISAITVVLLWHLH